VPIAWWSEKEVVSKVLVGVYHCFFGKDSLISDSLISDSLISDSMIYHHTFFDNCSNRREKGAIYQGQHITQITERKRISKCILIHPDVHTALGSLRD
jgi:hypothetical protein